ncbi:unnamed protein product [Meganyctiphanes norvegica]|uniref:Uncharacterized protein n=1 Tax=Meganyctiphanes norvegica TaxID=48144 RepID=A0AAV2S197_MEGNR
MKQQSLVLFSALCSLTAAALVPIPYSRGAQVVFTESKALNVEKIPAPGIKVFNNVRVAAPAVYSTPAPVVQAVPAVYSSPAPVVRAARAVRSAPAPAVYPAPAPVVVAVAPSPLDAPNPPMPSLDIPHRGGSTKDSYQHQFIYIQKIVQV